MGEWRSREVRWPVHSPMTRRGVTGPENGSLPSTSLILSKVSVLLWGSSRVGNHGHHCLQSWPPQPRKKDKDPDAPGRSWGSLQPRSQPQPFLLVIHPPWQSLQNLCIFLLLQEMGTKSLASRRLRNQLPWRMMNSFCLFSGTALLRYKSTHLKLHNLMFFIYSQTRVSIPILEPFYYPKRTL